MPMLAVQGPIADSSLKAGVHLRRDLRSDARGGGGGGKGEASVVEDSECIDGIQLLQVYKEQLLVGNQEGDVCPFASLVNSGACLLSWRHPTERLEKGQIERRRQTVRASTWRENGRHMRMKREDRGAFHYPPRVVLRNMAAGNTQHIQK